VTQGENLEEQVSTIDVASFCSFPLPGLLGREHLNGCGDGRIDIQPLCAQMGAWIE
jgi:hypothetical protein